MWKFGHLLGSDQASDWRETVALLSGVGVWVLHRGNKESWQGLSTVARKLEEVAERRAGSYDPDPRNTQKQNKKANVVGK